MFFCYLILFEINKTEKGRIRDLLQKSCENSSPVIIYYQDRNGCRTGRMIEPIEIIKDSYTCQEKNKSIMSPPSRETDL
jgi:hypothetical protein